MLPLFYNQKYTISSRHHAASSRRVPPVRWTPVYSDKIAETLICRDVVVCRRRFLKNQTGFQTGTLIFVLFFCFMCAHKNKHLTDNKTITVPHVLKRIR